MSRARAAVALAAVVAVAALLGTLRVRSVDAFWHLAAGRWILDHDAVPRADPFRFTSAGAPWIDHEWLFQVAIAAAERLGGIDLVVALRAALAAVLGALLFRAARRSGAPVVGAAAIAILAVVAARRRWFVRPEIVTVVALALLFTILQRLRERPRPALPSIAAVGLVAGWANAHPGVLVAPGIAGLFLLGSRLPGGARAATRPRWTLVLGLPLLLAAAMLANPYGVEIFAVPWKIRSALAGLAGTNPDWLPGWRAGGPTLALLLLGVGLVTLLAARQGRLDPATGLPTLALGALALASARQTPLFAVAAAFFAGEVLGRLRGELAWPFRPAILRPARLLGLLAIGASIWAVAPPRSGPLAPSPLAPRFGTGVEPGLFPDAAVAALGTWPDLGNLYNDVAFGGYLLWRTFPPRQVFVDSRNEVDPQILRAIAAARADGRAWEALLARYAVDGALVRYDERPRPVLDPSRPGAAPEWHTTHALLFPPERFALVHWDDRAMLFVRRTPARQERLAREEWRFVHPEDWRSTLGRAARDEAFRARVRGELLRKLGEDPGSERARGLLAAIEGLAGT